MCFWECDSSTFRNNWCGCRYSALSEEKRETGSDAEVRLHKNNSSWLLRLASQLFCLVLAVIVTVRLYLDASQLHERKCYMYDCALFPMIWSFTSETNQSTGSSTWDDQGCKRTNVLSRELWDKKKKRCQACLPNDAFKEPKSHLITPKGVLFKGWLDPCRSACSAWGIKKNSSRWTAA